MRRFRTKVDFFGGVRRVVRDIGAGDGVMRQGVRNVGGAMSFGGLIQEVEVRTDVLRLKPGNSVQTKTLDHFTEPRSISSRPALESCLLNDAG